MIYELKQYACNDCGELSDVLDTDQQIPKGWLTTSRLTHYCPKCAKKHVIASEIARLELEKQSIINQMESQRLKTLLTSMLNGINEPFPP